MQACHYCGENANTMDHIVARAWLRKQVPQALAMANKVPACQRCNNLKSHFRSDCVCTICEQAWVLLAPWILPHTKSSIPIKPVLAIVKGD